MNMAAVPIRLRRAIADKDLVMVKRILKNNASYLQNPDFDDKSNTSLHLAAQHGSLDIVELLISLGHDAGETQDSKLIAWYSIKTLGPSFNTDGETPLSLAASHSQTEVVELLCSQFPATINHPNRDGATALHLACKAHPVPPSSSSVLPITNPSNQSNNFDDDSTVLALLTHDADVHALDHKGDSCLHYASTWGNLKAIRAVIQAGADPILQNKQGWTPQAYSVTVQAEVYYKNLVAEWEKRKAEEFIRTRERRGINGGGLRLVKHDAEDDDEAAEGDEARARAESLESLASSATGSSGLKVSLRRNDTWG